MLDPRQLGARCARQADDPALLAGRNIDAGFVVPTVAQCIDLVVHLAIDARGNRSVVEILAPTGSGIENPSASVSREPKGTA